MKKISKIRAFSTTVILVGLLSGCGSNATSIRALADQCRPPGGHTWVNFMDARVFDDGAIFEGIQIEADEILDPSPSCLLEKLSAPAEVFEEIKSSPIGEEKTRNWEEANVEWKHWLENDIELFDIYISRNKTHEVFEAP